MAGFNTAAFPDSLALGKPDSLLIGTIDEIQARQPHFAGGNGAWAFAEGCQHQSDQAEGPRRCTSRVSVARPLIVDSCALSGCPSAEAAHPQHTAGGAAAPHRAPGRLPHLCCHLHASQHGRRCVRACVHACVRAWVEGGWVLRAAAGGSLLTVSTGPAEPCVPLSPALRASLGAEPCVPDPSSSPLFSLPLPPSRQMAATACACWTTRPLSC